MFLLLLLLFSTHESNNLGNNSLLCLVKIHPIIVIPLFWLISKYKEEFSLAIMKVLNSKWSFSGAILEIVTKHNDGDLGDMKSLMQISLTHTSVYFDFSMVQILHNDPVITGYTDIVLRLKGTIAEQISYVTDLEGWKTI